MTDDISGEARKLFSFAVISDTHVNPEEDRCNSPFPVNGRANRRFRHVVADLNQRDIEFVIHLGDLVHPVPDTGALYSAAASAYRAIADELKAPIHVLPGNHDIGDTPVKGAPAGPTTPSMINAWTREFGAQYHGFSHDGIRYLLLNAQLINSGLPDEAVQRTWLEKELAQSNERIMLMLHHPAYLCEPNEPNHYDNTDAPGRQWLLDLLTAHGVEAMFAGHAHNFWYDRYHTTDFYLAPATSFVRQDYSEMLRAIPPADSEDGRDDRAKLGYFIVNVRQNGHDVQFVRTYGTELGPGDVVHSFSVLAPTPRENLAPLIGFDLRQNWAETTEVRPSGALDEFDRKRVRNDYPLLALIEMGVRNIRVPLMDLRDTTRRKRLAMLRHLGFHTTLFSFGVPDEADMALIETARDDFRDWEMTVEWANLDQLAISRAHRRTALPIYLSRMRSKDDLPSDGVYYHVINHGFSPDDKTPLDQLVAWSEIGVVGAVFRLDNQQPVAEFVRAADAAVSARGLQASVHLRVAGENPATPHSDHDATCQRIRQAASTVSGLLNTRIFCDTFSDVDRGYFVRQGAIDRCHNPNPLFEVVKSLHSSVVSDPIG